LERDPFKTYKSIQVDDILKSAALFYLTSAYKMEEPVSPDASELTRIFPLDTCRCSGSICSLSIAERPKVL